MSYAIIWIDHEQAKLTRFSETEMERKHFKAHHVDHHSHRAYDYEHDSPKFYDDVGAELGKDDRILIIGPGIAKKHFLNRLQEKHADIAKRVIACESSDHPTDNQISAYAEKYFQRDLDLAIQARTAK